MLISLNTCFEKQNKKPDRGVFRWKNQRRIAQERNLPKIPRTVFSNQIG